MATHVWLVPLIAILLTQVAVRLRDAFHVDVPLRMLFEMPTIEGMSTAVLARWMEEEGVAGTGRHNEP